VFRGIRDDGDFRPEACDDGNQLSGDGCSADCMTTEEGWVCNTQGITSCERSRCGDGVRTGQYLDGDVVRIEVCDDGNDVPGDGCTDCYPDNNCKPWWLQEDTPSCPVCGNHIVEPGEFCDDGNAEAGDGCANCVREPEFSCFTFQNPFGCDYTPCGNGVVESDVWNGCGLAREVCDDGNRLTGDGCDDHCQREPYFDCPASGGTCSPARCGDGIVNSYISLEYGAVQEFRDLGGNACLLVGHPNHAVGCFDERYQPDCNDGNRENGDGCSSECKVEPGPWVCPRSISRVPCHRATCGDGLVENFVEQCDDGNASSGDGCSADCVNEMCDDNGCRAPLCGNGVIEPTWTPGHFMAGWVLPEPCDDGNTIDGDGCSGACTIELGFVCPLAGQPCAPPRCGDGVVSDKYWGNGAWHFERCDDGNDVDCDGCTGCELDDACRPPAVPPVQ
jgi:cysteine-rich repeat protein